jgi:hypothetical protein
VRTKLLVVSTCAAIASAVVASAAVAQQPGQDSVTGTFGVALGGDVPVAFASDVHSGPAGEDPGGTFVSVADGPSPVTWSVDCLYVTGSTAVVGIARDDGFGSAFLRIEDAPVDMFSYVLVSVRPTVDACRRPDLSFSVPLPLVSGDIVVVDAPPGPTSKEQCKNAGWRNFGAFKNQGHCVSYVATRGKNHPAGAGS